MHSNLQTGTNKLSTSLLGAGLLALVVLLGGCLNASVENPDINPLPAKNTQQEPTQVNPLPEITVVTGLTKISTGGNHSCAIKKADDSLWCWGKNDVGQVGNGTTNPTSTFTVVNDDDEWMAVSGGQQHGCGIKTDNSLWCWGEGTAALGKPTTSYEQAPKAVIVDDTSTWIAVSTGTDHSCAIKHDTSVDPTENTLWCWGDNSQSQLGEPDPDATLPDTEIRQVGIETDWLSVSLGNQFSCGIRDNTATGQELWCWGANDVGQLGNNTPVPLTDPPPAPLMTPQLIGPDIDWLSVATGDAHACGIRNTDKLFCWGDNTYGQLGDGSIVNKTTPTAITADDNGITIDTWAAVATGHHHTCAIDATADSNLWCWGRNDSGQIGIGSTAHQSKPVKISHSVGWTSIAAGEGHSCAIDTDEKGHCWGLNTDGQVGNGIVLGTSQPRLYDTSTTWDSIDSGRLHTCGIKSDNTLWCGGSNIYGQLGNGSTQAQAAPVQVTADSGAVTTWASFATGHHHSCAISTVGALYCWGKNIDGQLGKGAGASANTQVNWKPVKIVVGADDWTAIAAGSNHTCGIKNTDELWCWGNNATSQLGHVPADTTVPSKVDASAWQVIAVGGLPGDATAGHSCAIKTDATLWCWGDNNSRQTGDGFTQPILSTPIPIPTQAMIDTSGGASNTDWQTVKAGNKHNCARKTDTSLWCWGDHTKGQSGNSTSTMPSEINLDTAIANTWSDFATGEEHSCAIYTDGDLWCWGINTDDQLTSTSTNDQDESPKEISQLKDWKTLALGQKHSCGIREDNDGNREVFCWGTTSQFQLGDGEAWKTTPQLLTLE